MLKSFVYHLIFFNVTEGDKEFLFTYAVTEALVTTSLLGCLHDNSFAAGEAASKHDNDFTTLKANLKKRPLKERHNQKIVEACRTR